MKAGKRLFLLLLVIIYFSLNDLFPQAASITGWRHPDYVYCSSESGDSLIGASPSGKPFYIDGVSYITAPALVKTADGRAIFYPNRLGTGTHTIIYGTIGSHDVTVIVTVMNMPTVTLSPFSSVCSNLAPFSLFSSDSGNVSPKNGVFSGPGVNASGLFDPASAGPGTHTITYTAGIGSCASSVTRPITVIPAPNVGLNPFPPVCEGSPIFRLTQGNPVGGSYSGPGVNASGDFDQAVTGIGSFPITYSYTNGTCSNTATATIMVASNPVAAFSGLANQYCTDNAGVNLLGNPMGVTGVFTGAGVTDNGNGTGVFSPPLAGLGIHQVNYIYTSADGCSDTAFQQVRVGTNVLLNGLSGSYCLNHSNITISGTPAGGTFAVTPGLADNGDGTALFSPSLAGIGLHTLSYTFIDGNGCINTRTQQVQIHALPLPSIQNLGADYCANLPQLIIRGNYAPSGTFAGAATTDNGNGTANFNPSGLMPGGPYHITYTYQDAVSGCQASVTSDVMINAIPAAILSGSADICYGDPATIAIALSGSGPFSFSYSDGAGNYTVNNAAGPVHNIQVFPIDTTNYLITTIADSKGCNNAGNGSALIKVLPQVSILTQPVSQTVCQGSNVQFRVTAAGVNLQYQWEKDGLAIAGAIHAELAINDVQPASIGSYRCRISGDCGIPITSNDALLQLWSPTVLILDPTGVYECEGENASLQIQATGSNLVYRWFRNNVALNDTLNFTGSSTGSLFISSLLPANSGNYHVVVTGSCGTIASNAALVAVDRNIVMVEQPRNVTICHGANAVFTTSASGDHLSYQWQFNNVDIPGESDATLSVPNTSDSNEGFYRCMIRSSCGNELFSDPAYLDVTRGPALSANPVSLLRCEGDNAVFSIISTGDSIDYQWRKDGAPLTDNGKISGSKKASLTINNVNATDIGNYTCFVSNRCGSVNSAPATLSVDTSLAILSQPLSVHDCLNSNVFFTVTANGNNLSYQWQKNGMTMPGETNPTLVINNIQAVHAGQYACVVSNSCGRTITSDPALLSIDEEVVITRSPADVETCAGNDALFEVQATGTGITYQWEYNGSAISDGGKINGTHTATLLIQNSDRSDEGIYNCLVEGACGVERTVPASLIVNDTIVIHQQPANAMVCEGNNARFTTDARGVVRYQWQKDEIDLPGEISPTLIISGIDAADSGVYRCNLFSLCDTLSTDGALLTVKVSPQVTLQPVAESICEGQQIQFESIATGSDINWQWFHEGTPLNEGNGITGTATGTLVITQAGISEAGVYSARVGGYCNTITTQPALLTVFEAPFIIEQPEPATACENQSASFSVIVSGAVTYQWQKENVDLAGNNTATLTLNNISQADEGVYTCRITGSCGDIYTQGALLTVNANTRITQQPTDLSLCEGDNAALQIIAAGDHLTFRWKHNGINLSDGDSISGSSSPAMILSPVGPGNSGIYHCEIQGTCGNISSNAAVIEVSEFPEITTQPEPVEICAGQTTSFRVEAKGSAISWQWQKEETDISGANSPVFSIAHVTNTDSGVYRCLLTGTCGQAMTDAVKLTVDLPPDIQIQPPASLELCQGNTLTASASATGTNLQYQWYFNGAALADGGAVSGSKSPWLEVGPVAESDEGIYLCMISNACSTAVSHGMHVTVDSPVFIAEQPENINACLGENVVLAINTTGDHLGYQWIKNGVDIAGAIDPLFSIHNIAGADSGTYQCVISSVCGNSASDAVRINVDEPLSITNNPPALIEPCEGTMISLNVTASGNALTYQWRKNGIDLSNNANLSGSQSPNLQIMNIAPGNAGSYHCIIQGTCNTTYSAVTVVDVMEKPAITIHPADYSVLVNGNATFHVTASGDGLNYQWYFNGSPITDGAGISGAGTGNLSITGVTAALQGAYNVVVDGSCDTLSSNPASLILLSSSLITTQPAGDIKCEGESVTIFIETAGAGHTYQWKKNGVTLSDNSRITGSQQDMLNISGLMAADAGSYHCLVDGIENSVPALLYVNRTTNISLSMGAGDFCEGATLTMFTEFTGDSLSWSWLKDGIPLSDISGITGSAGPMLVINPAGTSHAGSYTCEIIGACGNATSDPQMISVSVPVALTSRSSDTTICEGQSAALSVGVSGDALSWQWYKNGAILSDGAGISGSQSHTLLISDAGATNEGMYNCVITGVCNKVYTELIRLTVQKLVSITVQPVSSGQCAGDLAVFTVNADVSTAIFQWQKDGIDLTDNAQISGSASGTLQIRDLQLTDSGIYQCVIRGACNEVLSSPARLNVYEQTRITEQPSDGVVCEGQSTGFSVSAVGRSLSYQWIRDGVNLTEGGSYNGTNSQTLHITDVGRDLAGVYQCLVTGICEKETSAPAALIVNTVTSITHQPANSQICEGSDLSLSAPATGTGNNYQWEKDNLPLADVPGISGSKTPVLQLTGVSTGTSGIYRCVVSGVCNMQASQAAQVVVLTAPEITGHPHDTTLCEGNNLLLKIYATGSDLGYIWKADGDTVSNGGNFSGAETSDLYIQHISSLESGNYHCQVSNICGYVNSDPASIIINQHGALITQPQSAQKCRNDQVSFFVRTTGNNLSFQWEFEGSPLTDGPGIAGSLTETLTLTQLDQADDGIYRCTITDGCGTLIHSDPATLTVYEPVNVIDIPAGDTLCEGQSVTLTITAGGSDLSWQWYKNGSLLTDGSHVTGSNAASLILDDVNVSMSGSYSCEITGACGKIVIPAIPVLVQKPVEINDQPDNLVLCTGESAVFSVSALGDSLTYQWFRDGNPLTDVLNINGSHSSLLMLSGLTPGETGSYYCEISGACGKINSQTAVLTVNGYPAPAGSITGEPVVCQATKGESYIVPAIPDAVSYRWTLPPGMVITSGQDTRQIEVTFTEHESGGPVYVTGINECGAGVSSPVLNVVANPLPVTYAGESTGICSDEGLLTAYEPEAPATGLWQVIGGPAVIDQPAQAITSVNSLRNGANHFAWTVTLNGCTSSDTVTIYNNHLVVEAGKDTSICGHIYTLNATVPPTGTGQWSIVAGAGYNMDRYNAHTLVTGLAQGQNVFKWSVNHDGCISYDTVRISNNLPTEAEAGNDQFIQADNTNLNANDPMTGTGEWSLLNGSAVISDPMVYNSLVTDLGQGKNIFEWQITHKGCISKDTVVVENIMIDTTDAGPNQVICSNSVRLNAKDPYPGYGEWSVRRGAATFASNSLYNTYAYNLSQGENVLVWTVYLNGRTSDSVIIVNDLPTMANAGVNLTVCTDSAGLNSNMPYTGSGLWTVINGAGTFENDHSNTTSVTHLARGNNSFKWTITNGTCSSSSTVIITNNKPTDAEAGFDAVTCEDSLVLKPNVPTFGSGEWSVYSGSAKFKNNLAYDLGKNDNLLIYTIRNGMCYSRDTVVITSHKPTMANLGADQSVCQDSVMMMANIPVDGTGIWSLQSGSAVIGDVHLASTLIRNIGAGENVLRWTITYLECHSFDDIVISNDYMQADAGEDQTLCSDRSVLEANDPGYSTGTWTVIGGSTGASLTDPHAHNTVVENLIQGPNILRWTISKNSCISYDEVIIINNNPTRSFAGEDTYLCHNEIQLRANPIATGTGTWTILSGAGNFADANDPLTIISNLGSGSNVLRWTSEKAGCVTTDEVIIGNNLPLNVYAGLDQTLCADSTILYANPPALGSGTWSILQGSGQFTDPLKYNTTLTRLGNGVNRLKWTVATTGCSVTDTVMVVNNLPTEAVAGSDFPVCNSTGSLNANTPLYGTGEWSLVSGSGNIANVHAPRTILYDLALGNNILQWTITNGSCTSSDELMIVNNSPTIAEAGENAEVCGETAILYANSPIVGYGYWTVMSGKGEFADSLNFNTTVNGLNFGENIMRWTTRNGDCLTIDEITVANHLAYIYAGEDQVVYEPEAVLAGNNPGMGTGQWLLTAGTGNMDSPGTFSTSVTELGAGLNTFEWTIINGSCTAHDQVVINYKVMPRVGFIASQAEGCPGLTVGFINTTQYGTTYRWELGDGTVTYEVNPSHTYYFADHFTVRLTAFGPDNQQVTADTVISIHMKPVAGFQFAPDTAMINKPFRCYNNSYGDALTNVWDFGDHETSGEKDPMHYYRNSGEYDITLMVTSEFGCTDTLTKKVIVAEDGLIVFPNAFTPDPNGSNGGVYNENDRTNDVFHPYHENVIEFHMEIYSRWGVLLFESDDINIGWDGYYKGELLARDVYVWKATGRFVGGTKFLKTGNVLLVK